MFKIWLINIRNAVVIADVIYQGMQWAFLVFNSCRAIFITTFFCKCLIDPQNKFLPKINTKEIFN